MLVIMEERRIVVIGASEGGLAAVRELLSGLAPDFQAPVFIVIHIGPHPSTLPELLSTTDHSIRHPTDGEVFRAGQIFIAPPDYHMLVADGRVRLTRGPRENFARPSIDPLFRSAAQEYGPGAIGVILTGGLNDGTAGLYEIARQGGATIVQDPSEALNPSMPQSALRHVAIDHCAPLAEIAPLLTRMIAGPIGRRGDTDQPQEQKMDARFSHDPPVAITCPDCGGALREIEFGSLKQYRCHIGHAYTAEVMLAGQRTAMERSLEAAMRAINERAALCRRAAQTSASPDWSEAADQAVQQAEALRAILEVAWADPEPPAGRR